MNEAVDLFGNKVVFIKPSLKKKEKTLFDDYKGFVNKFETKKTTDDCYTPPEVYNCVLKYVSEKCDIKGVEIVRPFYLGGDYENCEYPDGCVVIDNPPFSIVSKIGKFYMKKGIKFFLFAPHLTLFSAKADYTRIVVGASITYENGANIKTSFISNIFKDISVMSDARLYRELEKINEYHKVNLPIYEYPVEVLTVSQVQWCVERGVSIQLKKEELHHIDRLDSQKKVGKSIFGSGYLLSENGAMKKEAMKKEAMKKEAMKKEAMKKEAMKKDNVIIWELSGKEKEIIKSLNKQSNKKFKYESKNT